MRKSRYSEEQIIKVLRQVAQGQKVADVCREHGIAHDTYYRWRRKGRWSATGDRCLA
jgi:putative transposase